MLAGCHPPDTGWIPARRADPTWLCVTPAMLLFAWLWVVDDLFYPSSAQSGGTRTATTSPR
ncbi:MAG: hypothetical protein OEV76_03020, partial [Anaerolineae bacterium]|nr:hypothetical protein [Anaerolineae bacterium]